MPTRYQRSTYFANPDFPLAVVSFDRQAPVGPHTHDFVELVFILSGRALHRTEAEAYPIAAGDVFVILPGSQHTYEELHGCSLVNVLFMPDELGLPSQDLHSLPGFHALFTFEPRYRPRHESHSRLRLAPDDLARVSDWLDRLQAELSERSPGYRFVTMSLLMQIIAHISRRYTESPPDAGEALLRLGEVVSHLEQHLHAPITVAELCDVAHMSESSLLRAFKQAYGVPPIDYLIRLRVLRATEALRRPGGGTITRIAYDVGFNDSNYFSRAFRKIMGESPSAYRRRHRSAPALLREG